MTGVQTCALPILAAHPAVAAIRAVMPVDVLTVEALDRDRDQGREYDLMNACHRRAIDDAYEAGAALILLSADVVMSAHALAALQGSVVKNSGQLSATSLTEKGGKVVFKDMIQGVTVKKEVDESTGVMGMVVIEHKEEDRKSTRLNSSHVSESRMPSSA